jgi:GT2 family glycosyltransferase
LSANLDCSGHGHSSNETPSLDHAPILIVPPSSIVLQAPIVLQASIVPPASIVIPTRGRPTYLEVALASIAPQAIAVGAELIVVDDSGPSEDRRALAERFGARYEAHPRPLGLNVARNTGVERSSGELVVFVDDDVDVCEGWLEALVRRAAEHPDVDVLAGAIVPRLEGRPARGCGREGPPITSLQLGPEDCFTSYAWGSNMAIRRAALERVGPFDVSLEQGGDEQEWQDRLRADGGQVLYVADATLHHRRTPEDSRLLRLCRASFARGRGARRFDTWRGQAPPLERELLTLARCLGHVLLRRCPRGLVMVAHSAGRVREAVRFGDPARSRARARGHPSTGVSATGVCDGSARVSDPSAQVPHDSAAARVCDGDDFLSGESGTVGGLDGVRRAACDALADVVQIASGQRRRLDRAARLSPPTRRVRAIGVERQEHSRLSAAIRAELERSRHQVELCLTPPGESGKFENLNRLLIDDPIQSQTDWLLVVDDDIALPRGFLDRFLFLAERFSFDLAQPAHAGSSHAAWSVTRRRPASVARETQFVEIGPLTAFARRTLHTLLPFPDLRMGWGLDVHWAALAREHGWRCGVIDSVAIRHRAAPTASSYSREQAIAEAREFLRDRPHLSASEVQRTLATHRSW